MKVVDDRGIGVPADLVALHPVETHHLVGAEPAEREDMGRIRLGHGAPRQADPVDPVVLHGPEHVPPCAIQGVGRLVALRAPLAERGARAFRVADRGVVAAVLVVRLPCDHVRIRAVALGEQAHDAAAFLAVSVVAEAVVAARTEPPHFPPRADRRHVGVAVDHPARRRGGRRPQHDSQPGRAQGLDRPVEPVEPELSGLRLEARPGELADAHAADAGPYHARRVLGPDRLRPVLGVVADAERALHARHAT